MATEIRRMIGAVPMLLGSHRAASVREAASIADRNVVPDLDPSRFAAVVRRYQLKVHRLVAGILGPTFAADAEDATQEVFLHAYRKLESFRGESRFSTWLYRLAYNRALDYRRKLARRSDLPFDEGATAVRPPHSDFAPGGFRRAAEPLAEALARERAAVLRARLEELPQSQRTAVYLHYWLGCSIAEIAELTDHKPATVKSHLFRARRALARRLGEASR